MRYGFVIENDVVVALATDFKGDDVEWTETIGDVDANGHEFDEEHQYRFVEVPNEEALKLVSVGAPAAEAESVAQS